MTNHEPHKKKKWSLFLLWVLLLAGALAGVWWYYHHKIDRLDHKLDAPLHQPTDSMGCLAARGSQPVITTKEQQQHQTNI